MENKTHNEKFVLKSEPLVSGMQLLCEILSLMKDYFEGSVSYVEQGILYRMPNGQQFYITAREPQSE